MGLNRIIINNIDMSFNTKTYLSLNHNISCEQICQNIQKLLNNYKNTDISNCVIVISINEITDSKESLLPKIGVITNE